MSKIEESDNNNKIEQLRNYRKKGEADRLNMQKE